ncbi:GGDEF domain-containing protein [Azorhizobium oxalatiphilum]|uniref:diguanylate cyclase n=1 Tax=Azorhizobium oxalatiphilum TaxID=980631 RepID=A0A917FKV2_9HYPH|nr:GGDEF domain-containing protein [Azorhizobium oxalatiphilum]GGF86612.1 GGDEF domain-containing protein [Azorhizobium oxalatiphilum]
MEQKLGRQRQLICRILTAIGCIAVICLWTFETRAGLITRIDRVAYPVLLTALGTALGVMVLLPRWHRAAEWLAYLSFASYCILMVSFFTAFDADTQLYVISNTLQWMPMLYIAAFVMFRKWEAVVAGVIVFVLATIPLIFMALRGEFSDTDHMISSLVINAYAVHLVVLVSMSLFVVTTMAFDDARAHAAVLEGVAFTDALTGIANRRGLERILGNVAAGETTALRSIGLILMDVDHFKAINDTNGHLVGDRVLEAVAESIAGQLGPGDLAGRWGGDEFLLLCGRPTLTDAHDLAERVRDAVARLNINGVKLTMSAGVMLWNGAGRPEDALHRVDRALYAAKAEGRNRTAREPAVA